MQSRLATENTLLEARQVDLDATGVVCSSASMSSVRREFWAFALLLLLLRSMFLVAAVDPEEERVQTVLDAGGLEWKHGPDRPLYDREELYAGAAAEAMRLGLPLPLAAYRFMDYGSGSLVISLFARGVFALFGPTLLAFKIIPLLLSLGGGLCWFLLVRLWRGRRTALAFGLLFAAAPPVLVRTTLIAKGDHGEAVALIGATLLLASQAAFAATAVRRRVFAVCAGAAAGLGVFVTYSTVPIVGAVALTAVLRSRLRPRDLWLALLAGAAVGLVPWLTTVAGTQGSALRVYDRPLGALVDPSEMARRLQMLLSTGLFAGFDLPGGLGVRRLAGWVWLAAVLVGWIGLARDRRAPGAWMLIAGTLAHLLAFLLAAPDASSRYLVPVYPLLLIAVAVFAEPASAAAARRRRIPGLLVAGIGLVSALLVMASSTYPLLRAPLKGYDWPLLGEVLGARLTSTGVRAAPPSTQEFLWVGVGRRLGWSLPPSSWAAEAESIEVENARSAVTSGNVEGDGEDGAAAVWEGIGMALVESGRFDEIAEIAPSLADDDYGRVLRGVFRYPEEIFIPMLKTRGEAGVARFLARMDHRWRPFADEMWARQRATLMVQEASFPSAEVESYANAAQRLQQGEAAVPPAEAERALGWALSRGQALNGRPRFWKRPHRAPAAEGGKFLSDSAAFWEGVASARQWSLSLQLSGPEGRQQ